MYGQSSFWKLGILCAILLAVCIIFISKMPPSPRKKILLIVLLGVFLLALFFYPKKISDSPIYGHPDISSDGISIYKDCGCFGFHYESKNTKKCLGIVRNCRFFEKNASVKKEISSEEASSRLNELTTQKRKILSQAESSWWVERFGNTDKRSHYPIYGGQDISGSYNVYIYQECTCNGVEYDSDPGLMDGPHASKCHGKLENCRFIERSRKGENEEYTEKELTREQLAARIKELTGEEINFQYYQT